jgi:hypothetical protein
VIEEAHVIDAWCRAVSMLYSLARGERLGELNGRRSRLIDERGLHPFSLEVGRIFALQDMYPQLEELEFNHLDMRRAAQVDAERDHDIEVAVTVGVRLGWLTEHEAESIRTEDHARARSRQ